MSVTTLSLRPARSCPSKITQIVVIDRLPVLLGGPIATFCDLVQRQVCR
ncbi:hypothetical protein [Quadrisphaera granulorum]|nr:hypothetical protein [Quadrisphaera granulorum]